MLKQDIVRDVLGAALSTGGDFAEVFVEDSWRNTLRLVNGSLEEAVSGREFGIGIRIFQGYSSVYAYTNDASRDALLATARRAAAALPGKGCWRDVTLTAAPRSNLHTVRILPRTVEAGRKVDLMRRAYAAAAGYHVLITQVRVVYLDWDQHVLIANSDGLWTEDERVRTRFAVEAVATKGNEKQTGYCGPGKQMGFEFFSEAVDVEALAREAARSAVTMINADICPSGRMPVVIANESGGVIFHEACGHGLEATAVAKGHSVFAGKLGQKIASDVVTAIDDGTIPNAWGSSNVDDEGTPTRRNVLIENGVLKGYLVDKLNSRRMGVEPTGAGRRQSYQYPPTSRMSNTYIAKGSATLDEMIANTEYGLYAKYIGGGSVDPATGEFNFAVREGYLIKNGKIDRPVRGGTLIGKGSEVLWKIDMVGTDLAFGPGMCGSISGSIPVEVGQPCIRVSSLTVGGRREM